MSVFPKLALLTAALVLLVAAPASAQGRAYVAAVAQPSTTNPNDWSPQGVPLDGDVLVTTAQTQIVNFDADIRLGGLRSDPGVNTPILRLNGATHVAVANSDGIIPELRNATVVGTAGQGNELTFVLGVHVSGNLRLNNGVSINVDGADGHSGLSFGGGVVTFAGSTPDPAKPGIRLVNGESIVGGPLGLSGMVSAIRPVFGVGQGATLRFAEDANVASTLVTRFLGSGASTGQIVADGGAALGRIEGAGRLGVRSGTTSRVVTASGVSLDGGELDFRQGADGYFPILDAGQAAAVVRTRIRTVAHPDADQAAAPQHQTLTPAPSTSSDNRYAVGRIDRGSSWAPSAAQDGTLVADRRVLARKEPVSGEDPPRRARMLGSSVVGANLVCERGDYTYAVPGSGTLGTFYRDGATVATNVPSYTLTAADVGHALTCAALVVDEYGNEIDDPADTVLRPELAAAPDEPTPNEPSTPSTPATPSAPATPATPATPAAATAPAPAAPAAPATAAAPRAARTLAVPVPAIAAAATTPARCPTVAELQDVDTAWKLAQSTRSQTTLTGSATPGIWRCSVTGTENGKPVVVRSLPVLVANQQRAMLTSETAQTPKLRNPTLLSSGTQRISARLYARGGDAKLKTRTTKFTQTVRKGENTVRFTQTVGSTLPKGRYKLVVRAITADGLSAPLVQEVTIG